jgi:hypothetical protein
MPDVDFLIEFVTAFAAFALAITAGLAAWETTASVLATIVVAAATALLVVAAGAAVLVRRARA